MITKVSVVLTCFPRLGSAPTRYRVDSIKGSVNLYLTECLIIRAGQTISEPEAEAISRLPLVDVTVNRNTKKV